MGAFPLAFPSASLQLGTTPGDVLYTCPAGAHARITKLLIVNSTSAGTTITIHLVRSGDSIADDNLVVVAAPVPAKETAPFGVEFFAQQGLNLNPGDFLQAFAEDADALTPNLAVTEFT